MISARRAALGVILTSLVAGAAYEAMSPTSIADAELVDGRIVRQVVPRDGAAVVLVYDPADCAQCNIALNSWQEWGRVHPGRLIFVLTRPPTAAERRELRFARLSPIGELAPTWRRWVHGLPGRHPVPVEALLVDGKQMYKGEIPRGVSTPLLSRIATFSQADLASPDSGKLAILVSTRH